MTPEINSAPKSSLVHSLQAAASQAGLVVVSISQGADFHGEPTAIFELGLPDLPGRNLRLELSSTFDFDKPDLLPTITTHLAGEAKRLRNPHPECYVTLGGLPIAFGKFLGKTPPWPLA